jgi:polar amino acid transport system substrate-binding protein/glutamate/aspartate transport system substrate-binding protein
MRRRVLIAAMLVFAAQAASAGTLERVKETGVFRIGYRADARAYSYQDNRGRPGFELSKRYFSYETYALALPRDDSAFRLLVDKTLARLYRTGKVNAILTKTFGGQPPDEMLSTMFLINALPE